MSIFSIRMQCWQCSAFVLPGADGWHVCPACGADLDHPPLPDGERYVEKSCDDCGALVMWPEDEADVLCSDCVRRLVTA